MNEQMLIQRINELTVAVFLQEMRAQVLVGLLAQANAVIEEEGAKARVLAETICGQIEAYDRRGRMC